MITNGSKIGICHRHGSNDQSHLSHQHALWCGILAWLFAWQPPPDTGLRLSLRAFGTLGLTSPFSMYIVAPQTALIIYPGSIHSDADFANKTNISGHWDYVVLDVIR